MKDVPIIFSSHAFERLKHNRISVKTAKKEIRESIVEPLKKNYKDSKYKAEKGLYHFVNGKHLYTVCKQHDEKRNMQIALVITVFNKNMI